MSSRFYSCEFSQQAGEQLFGTATRADVWFCLEYARPWGYDALAESSIPDSVKQHIASALSAVPQSRLELIKRRSSSGDLAFYIAISGELSSILFQFRLDSYEDLLKLDIPSVVAGDPAHRPNISEDPIYLVCANGRRDVCCARYGLPIYEVISKRAPELTWQSSHIGGHRFAANAVVLPEGVCYGRLDEHRADAMVEAYCEDRLVLDAYRGRSCYDEPIQAADYFLRAETGLMGIYDLRLDCVQQNAAHNWTIDFATRRDGKKHRIQLNQDRPGVQVYKSSGDADKAWVPQYRLIGHTVISEARDR